MEDNEGIIMNVYDDNGVYTVDKIDGKTINIKQSGRPKIYSAVQITKENLAEYDFVTMEIKNNHAETARVQISIKNPKGDDDEGKAAVAASGTVVDGDGVENDGGSIYGVKVKIAANSTATIKLPVDKSKKPTLLNIQLNSVADWDGTADIFDDTQATAGDITVSKIEYVKNTSTAGGEEGEEVIATGTPAQKVIQSDSLAWDGTYKWEFDAPMDLTDTYIVISYHVANWNWGVDNGNDGKNDATDWGRNIDLNICSEYTASWSQDKSSKKSIFTGTSSYTKDKTNVPKTSTEVKVKVDDTWQKKEAGITSKADITQVKAIHVNTNLGYGTFYVDSIKIVKKKTNSTSGGDYKKIATVQTSKVADVTDRNEGVDVFTFDASYFSENVIAVKFVCKGITLGNDHYIQIHTKWWTDGSKSITNNELELTGEEWSTFWSNCKNEGGGAIQACPGTSAGSIEIYVKYK